MDTKHTPTPWYASTQPEGHFDIMDGPNLNTATVLCTRFEFSERKDEMHANAAFIVRACNSHEQLVAALQEAIEIIQAIDQADNTCSKRIDVSEFRAALTAAGAA